MKSERTLAHLKITDRIIDVNSFFLPRCYNYRAHRVRASLAKLIFRYATTSLFYHRVAIDLESPKIALVHWREGKTESEKIARGYSDVK